MRAWFCYVVDGAVNFVKLSIYFQWEALNTASPVPIPGIYAWPFWPFVSFLGILVGWPF